MIHKLLPETKAPQQAVGSRMNSYKEVAKQSGIKLGIGGRNAVNAAKSQAVLKNATSIVAAYEMAGNAASSFYEYYHKQYFDDTEEEKEEGVD